MSLILEGINLPKEGEKHQITIYDNGNTYIITSNRLYETDKKDIEAIQIPTPHGRLIDKDELLSHLKKDPLFSLVEQYGISGVIESRPTILDKERE